MDEEIWRPLPIRPQYSVSSLGRIKGPLGLRKPKKSKDGYLRISLGPRPAITVTMHAIVARTFLGERLPGHCVAHKNGIKDDNRLENLQYTTYRANMLHRRTQGGGVCPLLRVANAERQRVDEKQRGKHARGEAHGMSILTEAKVLEIHRLYGNGERTATSVARELNINPNTVYSVIAGRAWRHLHPDATLRT